MAILDFSVSGWHGFGSVTQVCFGISVSNFMCMSFVAVGRSVTIVSYVAFKMAALWFWTMFNCNPPIAHCHPLLWGGGILVDHWSTISSFGYGLGQWDATLHYNGISRWLSPYPEWSMLTYVEIESTDWCIVSFDMDKLSKIKRYVLIQNVIYTQYIHTKISMYRSP